MTFGKMSQKMSNASFLEFKEYKK